jgi:hypothetical protein
MLTYRWLALLLRVFPKPWMLFSEASYRIPIGTGPTRQTIVSRDPVQRRKSVVAKTHGVLLNFGRWPYWPHDFGRVRITIDLCVTFDKSHQVCVWAKLLGSTKPKVVKHRMDGGLIFLAPISRS